MAPLGPASWRRWIFFSPKGALGATNNVSHSFTNFSKRSATLLDIFSFSAAARNNGESKDTKQASKGGQEGLAATGSSDESGTASVDADHDNHGTQSSPAFTNETSPSVTVPTPAGSGGSAINVPSINVDIDDNEQGSSSPSPAIPSSTVISSSESLGISSIGLQSSSSLAAPATSTSPSGIPHGVTSLAFPQRQGPVDGRPNFISTQAAGSPAPPSTIPAGVPSSAVPQISLAATLPDVTANSISGSTFQPADLASNEAIGSTGSTIVTSIGTPSAGGLINSVIQGDGGQRVVSSSMPSATAVPSSTVVSTQAAGPPTIGIPSAGSSINEVQGAGRQSEISPATSSTTPSVVPLSTVVSTSATGSPIVSTIASGTPLAGGSINNVIQGDVGYSEIRPASPFVTPSVVPSSTLPQVSSTVQPTNLVNQSATFQFADQTALATIPVLTTSTSVFTSDGQIVTSLDTFTRNRATATLRVQKASGVPVSSSQSKPIIGGSIAAILFFLITGIIIFVILRRRRRPREVTFVRVTIDSFIYPAPKDLESTLPPAGLFDGPAMRKMPVPHMFAELPVTSSTRRHGLDLGVPTLENPFDDQDPFIDQVKPDSRRLTPVSNVYHSNPVQTGLAL